MARFTVSATPDAQDELADLIANSPPSLAQDITDASNRIDRELEFADLLLPYRGMTKPPRDRAHTVYPLIALYEVDETTHEVFITDYQLVIQLHRP